jgi:hypothetical protein
MKEAQEFDQIIGNLKGQETPALPDEDEHLINTVKAKDKSQITPNESKSFAKAIINKHKLKSHIEGVVPSLQDDVTDQDMS